ncbi:hypothetical protein FHG87_003883 [Trinorchestia longiramus]|nr:hypothetical protein FHG87_003883 [Trinorchestia longiramus]
MYGINIIAWTRGDHEKLEVLQNRYEENQWNARKVEVDSGMGYLLELDEECDMKGVYAIKYFLLKERNYYQSSIQYTCI